MSYVKIILHCVWSTKNREPILADAIGESQLTTVRRYVENQEEHHRKHSFSEEYARFMEVYKFEK